MLAEECRNVATNSRAARWLAARQIAPELKRAAGIRGCIDCGRRRELRDAHAQILVLTARSIWQAASENRDVKIAAERVRAARAGETISCSWLLPSLVAPDFQAMGGGASVSWEIDLSGRLRAGSKIWALRRRG